MKRLIKELLKKFKSCKARENSDLYINLSDGNKKLTPDEKISFLIWNIPAVITCPFATELCKKFCYAKKSEIAYPDVLPARTRNFEISKSNDFVLRMIYTICVEIDRPKNKHKKIVFRIHESGDFYNQEYVNKWLQIINYFKNDNRIVFVAYTKSVKYFDGVEIPKNFKLLASVWDDTKPENIEIIRRNHYKIYTAFCADDMKTALQSGFTKCRCEDCATCGKCWGRSQKNIACEIH